MVGRDFFQWQFSGRSHVPVEADGSQKTAFSILKMKTWTTALASVGKVAELLPGSCASERARTRGQLSSKVSVPHWARVGHPLALRGALKHPATTTPKTDSQGEDSASRRLRLRSVALAAGAPCSWTMPLQAHRCRGRCRRQVLRRTSARPPSAAAHKGRGRPTAEGKGSRPSPALMRRRRDNGV